MTDPKPGEVATDRRARELRQAVRGTPLDVPLTPADRATFAGSGASPRAPLSNTRRARIDNLVGWYQEQTVLDNVDSETAVRRCLEAAIPPEATAPNPIAKILAWALFAGLAGLILAFLIPALTWCVGYVLVPIWTWGTSWI